MIAYKISNIINNNRENIAKYNFCLDCHNQLITEVHRNCFLFQRGKFLYYLDNFSYRQNGRQSSIKESNTLSNTYWLKDENNNNLYLNPLSEIEKCILEEFLRQINLL